VLNEASGVYTSQLFMAAMLVLLLVECDVHAMFYESLSWG
jgi:hypothetical protein